MERFSIPAASGIIERTVAGELRVLLQERQKPGAEFGLLEIPGGKVRASESVFACLRREIAEETGLTVTRIEGEPSGPTAEHAGYAVISYTPFACADNVAADYPIVDEVFICAASGEPGDSSEARNSRWVSLTELAALLRREPTAFYPMHLGALQKYLRYRGIGQ